MVYSVLCYDILHNWIDDDLRKCLSAAGTLMARVVIHNHLARRTNDATVSSGDLVYDVADPRHIGRVKNVTYSGANGLATIKWLDTGWVSVGVRTDSLRHAPKEGFAPNEMQQVRARFNRDAMDAGWLYFRSLRDWKNSAEKRGFRVTELRADPDEKPGDTHVAHRGSERVGEFDANANEGTLKAE